MQTYALSSYCAVQAIAHQRDAQSEAQQKLYRELTDKWRRKHYEISIKLHHLAHGYAAQMVKEDRVAPEVGEINAWADILALPDNMSAHEYASREFRRNPNVCDQP
ncbi:hypothetical protein [Chromobacterium phragmitis]|uniref:hypothetical protein n=1 Tax=Chromobacterium phragmitis TaxID=2202141 RepID=UPI0011AE7CE2|nr:hypothetical protein [Chromobacterium phragmitis]